MRRDEPLAAYTALGVGGKADLFYITETSGDLVKAIRLARSFKVPVTVIGTGTGIVVADSGIRGLVVKNTSKRIQIKPQKSFFDLFRKKVIRKAEVVIDGGVEIDYAIEELKNMGILGFEKYTNLSGTIGAIVSNEEGKEFLKKVSILDEHGGVRSVGGDKKVGTNIVTDATYQLCFGEVKKTKKVGKKRIAGVRVFADLHEDEILALGYPSTDMGYIIGEILNMKGYKRGKMAISDQDQNRIVNLGGGTAEEFVALVEEIKSRARESIGIELVEKVVRLGWS